MKRLLVTLLVLTVVAVGLDRGGDFVAERVAAGALRDSQGLDQRPDVDINGIPFLDQFAANRYDQVEVRARGVPLDTESGTESDSDGLVISELDVVLDDVTTTRDLSSFDVARASADGVIGFDDLGEVLGVDLAYAEGDDDAEGGGIEVSRTFDVLGEEVSPSVTVSPEVVDGALGFGEPTINGANDAAGAVLEALNGIFGTPVPLQGIPFDIEVDSVSVERDGLHLALSGEDLRYDTDQPSDQPSAQSSQG